jgi:predicted PurR-regulated permease PerM
MAEPVKLTRGSRLTVWASVCIVVAALYLAQEVLIPLALAVLFTFVLAPLVARLERLRVPRVPAVLVVVLLALGLFGGLGWLVQRQFVATAEQLPTYTDQIRAKLQRMGRFGNEVWQSASNVQRTVRAVMPQGPAGAHAGTPTLTAATPENPVPVRMHPAPGSPVGTVLGYVGAALSPLATAGMVVVFVIFMLLNREDLRDRLIRLLAGGRQQVTVTTAAIDDAATRVSRYLLMQLIVNATYGLTVAAGLWVIGRFSAEGSFPSVLLWGLLCCVLRFIPYVGPWIAAAFPVALSFAMFRSTGIFASTLLLFVVIELWSNNMMEPWLYGSSTGMSEVAILLSAVFWTWLWGPIGLLMSTPLTVILVVLGKYVPALRFLDILLGDEPVLDPPTRLYQRLLARDGDEANDLAHELLAGRGIDAVYDEVLVPALGLAERDRRRRRLDPERHGYIRERMREIISDLAEADRLEEVRRQADAAVATAKGEAADVTSESTPMAAAQLGPTGEPVCVVCLPAEDVDDELAGCMLTELLERRGYRAVAASPEHLASEMLDRVSRERADLVCVSALPPAAIPHSRYLVKRLLLRFPEMPTLVGLWTEKGDPDRAKARISPERPVAVATTLADAVHELDQMARTVAVRGATPRSA